MWLKSESAKSIEVISLPPNAYISLAHKPDEDDDIVSQRLRSAAALHLGFPSADTARPMLVCFLMKTSVAKTNA